MREPSEWSGGPSDIEGKTKRVGASTCGQRTSFNRTRVAGHLDEIQGVVANTVDLFRQGAVGFIDWLGRSCSLGTSRESSCASKCVTALKAFGKLAQTSVERCRIVPERRMPGVHHDVDLSVCDAGLVSVSGGWLHDRVFCAMGNQHRLANVP